MLMQQYNSKMSITNKCNFRINWKLLNMLTYLSTYISPALGHKRACYDYKMDLLKMPHIHINMTFEPIF